MRKNMRKFIQKVMLGLVTLTALAATQSSASAQNYPWCLVISDKTGSWTCYFTTREQCMMSAGGNVGFCTQNPAYSGPPASRRHPNG
jgi:hypothetical protein